MMVSALRVGHSLIASLGAVAQDSREPISGEIRSVSRNKTTCRLAHRARESHPEAPIQDFVIFVAAVLIRGKWRESGRSVGEGG